MLNCIPAMVAFVQLNTRGSQLNLMGQTIASQHEGTLNSRCCWDYSKIGLHSIFGITIICLDLHHHDKDVY